MFKGHLSLLFFFIELACLAFIFFTGSPIATGQGYLLTLEVIAFFLVAWSVIALRGSKFYLTASVAKESKLVTFGPYSFIRHPMYIGIMLLTLALIIDNFDISRFIAWVILAGNFIVMSEYEETLLLKHFEDYKSYKKKVSRFIPFIY